LRIDTPATAYPAGFSCTATPPALFFPFSARQADPPVQITTGIGVVAPDGM
jgi:hypothetical protein